MENRRQKRQKIRTVTGIVLAIVLLLYWLTLAIGIDDDPNAAVDYPAEETARKLIQVKTDTLRNLSATGFVLLSKTPPQRPSPEESEASLPGEKSGKPVSKEFDLYDNILVFCVFHWYYIILCLSL